MTSYLKKRTLYPPLIQPDPDPALGLVVVIPAREEPQLLETLQVLSRCTMPEAAVEIIIVINSPEDAPEQTLHQNRQLYDRTLAWIGSRTPCRLRFHVLHFPALPAKHAGVGLARKIGMDEACRRLEKAGCTEGVIAGLDADSLVDPNYLTAIAGHFRQHPEIQAGSIYFEHPLEGTAFPPEVYEAIARYELHLRYFIDAQRYAGFPFAYQTIGSSMAVRCDAYQQQGGMNRRKAGEDFYFLHKFTPLGRFSELNDTRVIPSPRPSARVPFGTGRAVREFLKRPQSFGTYAPQSFLELQQFFSLVTTRYPKQGWQGITGDLPPAIAHFLEGIGGKDRLEAIRQHTASAKAFTNRFFRWFNAFQIMKFVHFARDHFYRDVEVEAAASWLLEESGKGKPEGEPVVDLLRRYRAWDRGGEKC